MAHRFDVVPIRADDESRVVVRVVLRAHAGGTVVFASRCESREVEGLDLLTARCLEGQVKVRGLEFAISAYAQRSGLVRAAKLDTKWALRDEGHTEWLKGLDEKGLARLVVADSKHNVIEHEVDVLRWLREA